MQRVKVVDGIGDWRDITAKLNKCGYNGILTFELKILNSKNRYDNEKYQRISIEQYIAEAYARACRVATLIVWEWGIRDKSVKKMAAIILGIRISKTQQLSNWEADVLTEPQCKYAATDAWVCREMYIRLMRSEKNPLKEETV